MCDSVLGYSLEVQQGSQRSFHVDGEHGIALHTMQGNWASSLSKGEFSQFFSSFGVNLGYIL